MTPSSSSRLQQVAPCRPASGSPLPQANPRLLRRLGRSRDAAARVHWRNALVSQNIGLVRLVANRESRRTGRPFDELFSAGALGLIRAVECFDTSRGTALSSFAVPYIRGAMLVDQRDCQQPIHTPRRLRELQQRANRLQRQRQAAGLPLLSTEDLAGALGCTPARLEEAERVQRSLSVVSLDQPPRDEDGASTGSTRLDQLDSAGPLPPADSQRDWLLGRLALLDPADRELLEGRWIDGLSWLELGALRGSSGRDCRRRAQALLLQLQAAGQRVQAPSANSAARAV